MLVYRTCVVRSGQWSDVGELVAVSMVWAWRALALASALAWAGGALALPGQLYHNQFAVHVPGGEHHVDDIAKRHGFENLGQVSESLFSFVIGQNIYLFETNECIKDVSPVSFWRSEIPIRVAGVLKYIRYRGGE